VSCDRSLLEKDDLSSESDQCGDVPCVITIVCSGPIGNNRCANNRYTLLAAQLMIKTAVSVVTGGGIFAGVIFVLCLNVMAMSRVVVIRPVTHALNRSD